MRGSEGMYTKGSGYLRKRFSRHDFQTDIFTQELTQIKYNFYWYNRLDLKE